MIINHKPGNYDQNYKGPTPYIGCWGNGGCQYEANATACDWEKVCL